MGLRFAAPGLKFFFIFRGDEPGLPQGPPQSAPGPRTREPDSISEVARVTLGTTRSDLAE